MPGSLLIHLRAVSRLIAFPPGSHPVGILPRSLLYGFGLLHLPYMQVLKPSHVSQGLSLKPLSLISPALSGGAHLLEPSFSRSGFFKQIGSRSYWSYGKVNHEDGALIPEGRVLINTARSFVYSEGGLKGVLMASRLTGLSPNLTARFTPGTLISGYEVFEALRRGVAVPFRKRDAEGLRGFSGLKATDKGGMIVQPEPGVYEGVHHQDVFFSLVLL